MRIGLVCPYHMFKGGGVQEGVIALHKELTKRGHVVKIITPLPRDYDGAVPPHVLTIGVSATVTSFFNTQTQVAATVDTEAIDMLFAQESFDVLHFHEPWVPVFSRQLLTRSRSANVATSHAKLPDRLTSKTIANVFIPYTRGLLKYIHAYSAVSEPATEYIRNFIDEPITIIPNGIDTAKYRPPLRQRDLANPNILYIGRLEKRKGVRYLLQAYSLLANQHPTATLTLAGSGPEEQRLKDLVKQYKIPRVTFAGFVDEAEKVRLLHQAALFSSPAHYGESFGIVLLEAMAAGVPVVAGDNPGYETVMKERGLISLVNVQDAIDYARRMELLLTDQDIRKLWLKWAGRYVKQFDYTLVVDQYERLYKTALRRKARLG